MRAQHTLKQSQHAETKAFRMGHINSVEVRSFSSKNLNLRVTAKEWIAVECVAAGSAYSLQYLADIPLHAIRLLADGDSIGSKTKRVIVRTIHK